MERSEKIDELAAALAKAQGQLENASKDALNPHFRARYADLASVREALRKPLSDNGLAYSQMVMPSDVGIGLHTILMHASGQFIAAEFALPLQQRTAQAIGSAITYMRRYSLLAITGLAAADDDDDGDAASAIKEADHTLRERETSRHIQVTSGPPAPTAKAISMGRQFAAATSREEIDQLKRTSEFSAFWRGAGDTDREHVMIAVDRRKRDLEEIDRAEN